MMTRHYVKTIVWTVIIFACVAGLFRSLERTNSWHIFGVPPMQLLFADTIGVLAASDCQAKGFNVYRDNPCDPWGRIQVLGTATSYLARLGFDMADGYWLGWTLVVLFWGAALLLAQPSNPLRAGLIFVFLISPAVMLGCERANIDLFLFLLITLAVLLATRPSLMAQGTAVIPIWLAAIIKLYPVAAGGALLVCLWKRVVNRWVWLACLLGFGGWALLNFSEVKAITMAAPKPYGALTFGGELLFRYLADGFSEATRLATVITFFLVVLSSIFLITLRPLDVRGATPFQKASYLVGLAVLLFCFVATTNYDYRNIYFILLLPFFFFVLETRTDRGWCVIQGATLLLILFSFWREVLPWTLTYYLLESGFAWLMFVPLVAMAIAITGFDDLLRKEIRTLTWQT